MTTYTRNTIHGGVVKLKRGELTDSAKTYFTNGQCHALAYSLHKKLGLPIVLLEDALWEIISHVAVLLPDGSYLDARGVNDLYMTPYSMEVVADPEAFIESCGEGKIWPDGASWLDPDHDLAKHYADIVISTYYDDIAIAMAV